jgi:CheY-like chemotaxis protein
VLETRELNLNDVIESVLKMLRRLLGADITLHFRPGELPLIVADSGMLEQVLMNLAVNARDAMPNGGTLTIETGTETMAADSAEKNPEVSPGQFAWMCVSDTGSGIPPENLGKVFEPFFTTKEIGKGTGLGLATVYGIVKQHRGWIALQSKVNEGTAFKIFLPVIAARSKGARPSAVRENIRGGHETILVVEDETSLRELVRDILESYGYRVLIADCGAAALGEWQAHRDHIHLLLTDLVMPGGINGRQLAEQLRLEKPKLPIVFTSGYSADVLGPEFRVREGINFLHKPYPPSALARCVRACLDGTR